MKKQLLLSSIAILSLASATLAANTENDWTGSGTGNISTGSNWSLNHVPTVSEDATFNASSTGGIKHLDNASATFGSLNVTATSGTYTIRNQTNNTTSTLTLGGAGSTGNSVAPDSADLLYAASGGTLALTGVNGTLAILNVVLGQSGNFDAVGTINVSSVISGGFAINKTGAGILLLSGANTYSGGLTLSAGTLRFNNAAAAGTGTFTINGGSLTNTSGAAITASNAVTIGGDFTFIGTSSPATSNLTLSGPVTLTGNRAINVSGNTSTLEISGSIGGAFSLTKGGPGLGTLILSGNNTYSGGTNISAGTLQVAATGNLGTGNVSLTAGNVTLTLQGATNMASSATLSYINTDHINLSYSGNMTIAGLVVDGSSVGPGVYGASATNPDGAFAGVGTITVVPEPATIGMLALGGSLLMGAMRFRRKLR